jgi:uncharacterized OsmC-like protein
LSSGAQTSEPTDDALASLRRCRSELPEKAALALGVASELMTDTAADELRAIQEPLKQHYRAEPAAAVVTLQADGSLDDGVACTVNTGRALVQAGLHPASGGDGQLACSGDMLLQALVACAGVTMRAVATSLGLAVSGSVHAEGDLDFRGTLSVDKAAPVGFKAIRLDFKLDTDADEAELATLLRLTERYCVVFQTLANSPALSVTHSPVS